MNKNQSNLAAPVLGGGVTHVHLHWQGWRVRENCYAKPAGAIQVIQGESGLIVYQDVVTGALYFRDPGDFRRRMAPLSELVPSTLAGDEVRQRVATTPPHPAEVGELVELLRELTDDDSLRWHIGDDLFDRINATLAKFGGAK